MYSYLQKCRRCNGTDFKVLLDRAYSAPDGLRVKCSSTDCGIDTFILFTPKFVISEGKFGPSIIDA